MLRICVLHGLLPHLPEASLYELASMVSREEIYRALKEMHSYKVPKVDGFHAYFLLAKLVYSRGLSVLLYSEGLLNRCFDISVNKTLIALIPKIT